MSGGYLNPDYENYLNQKRALELQAMQNAVAQTSPSYSTAASGVGGTISSSSPSSAADVTGTSANNSTADKVYNTYADRLGQTYKNTVQDTVNNLNSRGLFGSGLANADIGKVNQSYAQSLSDLAGNIAGQEAGWNTQNVQNQIALANLGVNQQQANTQQLQSLLSLFS